MCLLAFLGPRESDPSPLGGVNSLSFSPDGKRIVSGSDGGRLQIGDAENGAEVSELVRVRLGGQSGCEVGAYVRLIDFGITKL